MTLDRRMPESRIQLLSTAGASGRADDAALLAACRHRDRDRDRSLARMVAEHRVLTMRTARRPHPRRG
jgi:hypothetical protein